jgi:hypothetical protein
MDELNEEQGFMGDEYFSTMSGEIPDDLKLELPLEYHNPYKEMVLKEGINLLCDCEEEEDDDPRFAEWNRKYKTINT